MVEFDVKARIVADWTDFDKKINEVISKKYKVNFESEADTEGKVFKELSRVPVIGRIFGGIGDVFKGEGIAKADGGGLAGAGMLKMVGAVATGVLIGESVLNVVQKVMSVLVESSDLLRSMLGLFKMSVLMILRPIGDFIALLLMPFLVLFMKYIAVPFYKEMLPMIMEMADTLTSYFLPLFEEMAPAIKDMLKVLVALPIGFIVAEFIKLIAIMHVISSVIYAIKRLIDYLKKIGEDIYNTIKNISSSLVKMLTAPLAPIGGYPMYIVSTLTEPRQYALAGSYEKNEPNVIDVKTEINIGNVSSDIDVLEIEKRVNYGIIDAMRSRGVIS